MKSWGFVQGVAAVLLAAANGPLTMVFAEEAKGEIASAPAGSRNDGTAAGAKPVGSDVWKEIQDLVARDDGFAADLYRMAARRLAGRDPLKAVRLYREAIKRNPTNAELKKELADSLLAGNQLKEAVAVWEQTRAENPGEASLLIEYANFLDRAKQLSQAAQVMRQAAALRPADVGLRYWVADAYVRDGKKAEAIQELKSIAKEYPKVASEVEQRLAALQGTPVPAAAKNEIASAPFDKLKGPRNDGAAAGTKLPRKKKS